MSSLTRWVVEKSHRVAIPESFESFNLEGVRGYLQNFADTYRPRPDNPPLGPLEYRYELDSHEGVIAIHAYYVGKGGVLQRFARVRKDVNHAPTP